MDIWKNQGGQNRTNNYGICNFNKVISSNVHTSAKVDVSLSYTDDLLVNNVRALNNLNVINDLSINNLYVNNDISTNNLYVANDITTNSLYVANDTSTNSLYVANDISTNNLHVVNDIQTNNLYVANDFSTNNLYVTNDISTNNLYVANDLSVNNNLKVNNNTDFNKLIVDTVVRDNLTINNDISFNSDRILITCKENGVINERKLQIINDSSFNITNESASTIIETDNIIYEFRNGFLIKPVKGDELALINPIGSTPLNDYTDYSQIDISKNIGVDLGITFFNKNTVATGTGTDIYMARIQIFKYDGGWAPISAAEKEWEVKWQENVGGEGGGRGQTALNTLYTTTNNSDVRNANLLRLKVGFNQTISTEAIIIQYGMWLITTT
jgi:hypothetical protein